MTDLVAKVTLTGDATGLVGASADGSAALDKLGASATAAGTAGGGMVAPFNAASAAIAGQAQASTMAAAALSASGEAKVQEIARLTQLASASSAATSNITALSAAHATYNATVNQARTLLAAGAIGQAEYQTAIEGASAKLALSKVAHDAMTASTVNEMQVAAALGLGLQGLGKDTEEAAAAAEHGGQAAEKFAIGAGHLGERAGLLRVPMRALKEIFESIVAEPEIAIFAAIGAAMIGAALATASYENSIAKLDAAMAESGNLAGGTSTQYQALAAKMADMADVSQHTGMAMAGTLIQANISTTAWNDLTQAATNMAHAYGISVPEAMQKLAESEKDPAKAAEDLAASQGMLSQAQIEVIRHMQEMGDQAGAQKQLADDIRDYFNGAADATSFWARTFGGLETAASKAFDAVGKFLAGPPGRMIGHSWHPLSEAEQQQAQAQADAQAAAQAQQAQQNQLQAQVAQINRQELYGGHGDEVAEIDAKILKLNQDLGNLHITSAQRAADNQSLAQLEDRLANIMGVSSDAVDKHTHAAKAAADANKYWDDQIRNILDHSQETIALHRADAAELQKEALASDGTAGSIKALQEQYAITKQTMPAVIALEHAHGAQADQLRQYIDALTASMKAQYAAQNELNAKQEVAAKFDALKSSGSAADVYAADVAKALAWKQQMLAAVSSTEHGYDEYAAHVEAVYNDMVKKARDDDLKDTASWSAGIERELNDLTSKTQNWAQTSAELVKGFSTQAEDAFVKFAEGGKNVLGNFFQWLEQALLKIAYEKMLQGPIDSAFGDLLGGAGGAGGGILSSLFGGGDMGMVTVTPSVYGAYHSGGTVGASPPMFVHVSPAVFEGAPRYHSGTRHIAAGRSVPGLAPGEVPIIALEGESVLNREQTRRADAMGVFRAFHDGGVIGDGAYAQAIGAPIVVQAPQSGGGSGPPVSVNVTNNAPGAQATAGQARQNNDGSWSLDVMVEQVDRTLAQRSLMGKSAFTQSLENTHGLRRSPIG